MKITRIINGIKQRFYRGIYRRRKNDTYILMMHEVTDGEDAKYPELSIEKSNLERLIKEIQSKGYVFDDLRNILDFSSKRVIVTFDDIFANVLTNAVPILEKYNVPFTVFITLEYIDQLGYISGEQIKQLIKNPLCTIGFHASKHIMMREHTNAEIAKIVNATLFSEKYNVECDYFAFPYGSMYACPKRAIREVAKLNYKAAFGTINSPVNERTVRKNRYYIPRVCVSNQSLDNIIKSL